MASSALPITLLGRLLGAATGCAVLCAAVAWGVGGASAAVAVAFSSGLFLVNVWITGRVIHAWMGPLATPQPFSDANGSSPSDSSTAAPGSTAVEATPSRGPSAALAAGITVALFAKLLILGGGLAVAALVWGLSPLWLAAGIAPVVLGGAATSLWSAPASATTSENGSLS